nr:MAG TPA: hypothetical protein [Caudoviricetes sp.]
MFVSFNKLDKAFPCAALKGLVVSLEVNAFTTSVFSNRLPAKVPLYS